MAMRIVEIKGKIEILTGLHIGAGDSEVHIGGIDSSVIKNPLDGYPYIPGSSLKGKMRSLLELYYGISIGGKPSSREDTDNLTPIIFGDITKEGMSRAIFRDCFLSEESKTKLKIKDILPTEEKTENSINRISGTAEAPRNIERVIPGLSFDFQLNIRVFDEDIEKEFKEIIRTGLFLLEQDSLGASGSRGYGKIKFNNLKWDDKDFTREK